MTLRMWKVFLQRLRGWSLIVDIRVLHDTAMETFADAARNPQLGWGAWFPHKGWWMYGKWEEEFFHQFKPSIDFLELYALLAVVVTWAPYLVDRAILFWSDNTPTIFTLKNKSSDSEQMLFLLHFLTLFCMMHNITILAKHVPGSCNVFCDKLSCFQFQAFHASKPDHTASLPSEPSHLIVPLSTCM